MIIMEQQLPIIPFGKHKGKSIINLIQDESYIKWCMKQPNLIKKYPKKTKT